MQAAGEGRIGLGYVLVLVEDDQQRSVRRKLRRFLHRHPKVAHAYKKWRDKARAKRLAMIRKEKEFEEKLGLHPR